MDPWLLQENDYYFTEDITHEEAMGNTYAKCACLTEISNQTAIPAHEDRTETVPEAMNPVIPEFISDIPEEAEQKAISAATPEDYVTADITLEATIPANSERSAEIPTENLTEAVQKTTSSMIPEFIINSPDEADLKATWSVIPEDINYSEEVLEVTGPVPSEEITDIPYETASEATNFVTPENPTEETVPEATGSEKPEVITQFPTETTSETTNFVTPENPTEETDSEATGSEKPEVITQFPAETTSEATNFVTPENPTEETDPEATGSEKPEVITQFPAETTSEATDFVTPENPTEETDSKATSVEKPEVLTEFPTETSAKFDLSFAAIEKLPLAETILLKKLQNVKEVLDTPIPIPQTWLPTLEASFAQKLGLKYAIGFMDIVSSVYAILETAGIGVEDEVILPPFNKMLITAIVTANATPVFADIDFNTFVISPESIRQKITSHTKAIITSSQFGLSPDMDSIMEISQKYHLLLIEDFTDSLSGSYKNRKAGTLGHVSCCSFLNNNCNTCEGSMVVTDYPDIANSVRKFSSEDPTYQGLNYRMPALCAAIVSGQLEYANEVIADQRAAAKLYAEAILNTNWLIPQYIGKEFDCAYQTYAVRLEHAQISRTQFLDKFTSLGGIPLHDIPKITYTDTLLTILSILNRYKYISHRNRYKYYQGLCPAAENLQQKLLCFNTNFTTIQDATTQAEILRKTIEYFNTITF